METIRQGSTGPDVVKWQTFLGVTADGEFGAGTKAATITWQLANGLTGDGVVGPATWAKAGFESPLVEIPPTIPPRIGSIGDPVELPQKFFKLTPDQAAKALSDGYARVTGSRPTANVLGVMMAQTALETSQWNLPNYNYGGVKFSASKNAYFQFLSCGEVINGVEVRHTAAERSPMCNFAAYLSAADGAEQYVRTLKSRDHWWQGLHTGTVEGHVQGLTTAPKYFTASPTLYLAGMRNLYSQFIGYAQRYAGTIAGFVIFLVGVGVYATWRLTRTRNA